MATVRGTVHVRCALACGTSVTVRAAGRHTKARTLTQPRSMRPTSAAAPPGMSNCAEGRTEPGPAAPARCPAGYPPRGRARSTTSGSLAVSRLPRFALRGLGLAVDDEAVDDPQADREHAQRPERVGAADRQQRAERAEGGRGDPEHAAEPPAGQEREPRDDLDDAQDDGDPAPAVQAREHVLRVVGEEMRIAHGAEAVDDVERPRDQQQDRGERSPAQTSQVESPSGAGGHPGTEPY